MSANDIFEWFLTGIFLLLFLLHPAVMVLVTKKNGGFGNRNLIVYTVLSVLPLGITGGFLIFGPNDLGGRGDLRDFYWVIVAYIAVNLLFCVVFLFNRLSELSLATRLKVLGSTILASVVSWLAFLGSVFATV
ncbi:MAG: hypothetical protein ABF384_13835 [Verrucomicrobiales bacterium]